MSAAHKLKSIDSGLQGSYAEMERATQPMSIVYGPVESRRLGSTLGINILGDGHKVCSYDCPYCDLGRTEIRMNKIRSQVVFPTPESVESTLRSALISVKNRNIPVKTVSISGNGEPTLHPEFPAIVDSIVRSVRDLLPEASVTCLTNGAHLDNRRVCEALNLLNERMVKVDAGNEALLKLVNAPLVRTSLSRLIAGTRSLKDLTAQSAFMRGAIDNTGLEDLEDWMEVIGLLKPKAVHIYGLSRRPSIPGLIPLEEDELYSIAARLERKMQIKALVFP